MRCRLRFGQHSEAVEDVLRFLREDELLAGTARLAVLDAWLITDRTLTDDFGLPYEDVDFESDEPHPDSRTWAEIKAEDDISYGKDAIEGFSAIDSVYRDEIASPILAQLEYKLREVDLGVIMDEFTMLALHRCQFGVRPESWWERLYKIYRDGGYVCGWHGHYPEGKLVVYVPPDGEWQPSPDRCLD